MALARESTETAGVELDADEWGAYFESLNAVASGGHTHVALSCHGRAEDRAIGRPLRTISYRAAYDEIELRAGGAPPGTPALRFFIASPRCIQLHRGGARELIVIDDRSGVRTVIGVYQVAAGQPAARRVSRHYPGHEWGRT